MSTNKDSSKTEEAIARIIEAIVGFFREGNLPNILLLIGTALLFVNELYELPHKSVLFPLSLIIIGIGTCLWLIKEKNPSPGWWLRLIILATMGVGAYLILSKEPNQQPEHGAYFNPNIKDPITPHDPRVKEGTIILPPPPQKDSIPHPRYEKDFILSKIINNNRDKREDLSISQFNDLVDKNGIDIKNNILIIRFKKDKIFADTVTFRLRFEDDYRKNLRTDLDINTSGWMRENNAYYSFKYLGPPSPLEPFEIEVVNPQSVQ